jgi:flagellar basal body L-ring protein FlgH
METTKLLIAISERSSDRCLVVRSGKDTRLPPTRGRRSSERTDTRRSSILMALLCLTVTLSGADTLWSTGFNGYLSDGTAVRVGDVVTVEIDSELVLSYSASSKDSKGLTLEFTGGEFGDLLSFLPAVKSAGDRTVKGEEKHEISADIVARVVELDAAGTIFIQGSKTLSFEGKQESLLLSGWVDPRDLGRDRRIAFSKIADSKIVFRSFLEPSEDILTEEDIEEVEARPEEVPPTETVTPADAETPGEETAAVEVIAGSGEGEIAQPASKALPQQKTYRLSAEKKKELFLRYVNRLIDLIFR